MVHHIPHAAKIVQIAVMVAIAVKMPPNGPGLLIFLIDTFSLLAIPATINRATAVTKAGGIQE